MSAVAPGLAKRIAQLKVGETAASARRMEIGFCDAEMIQSTITRLRNAASTDCARARETHPDASYTVETGDFRTKTFDLMCVVAVTRVA